MSDEGKREIAHLLRTGMGISSIEQALGTGRGNLYRLIASIRQLLDIKPAAQVWAEQQAEIVARTQAGESSEEIAAAMGLSFGSVYQQVLKLFGREGLPHLPLDEAERAEATRRLLLGHSINSIAADIGCSFKAVAKLRTTCIAEEVASTQPLCGCGKKAGHTGTCRTHGPVVDRLRELLRDGACIAEAARELGLSFQRANRVGRPILEKLIADGLRCPCGGELSHRTRCSAFPSRGPKVRHAGLGDRVAAMLDEGRTRAEIARAENVALSTVARLAAPKLAEGAEAGSRCRCGKPAGHASRCPFRVGRRVKPFHFGAALEISEYQRRRASFHARAGRSDDDIARRLGVSQEAVRCVVAALVAVGQVMAGCRCGLARNHSGECQRAPEKAAKPQSFVTSLDRKAWATMRRMYRSGLSAPAIVRATGEPLVSVRRHIAHWRSNDLKVRTCSCGKPARHAGSCSAHFPRALTPRWRRHVHALILQGRTTREIADFYSLSFSSVLPHTREARAELAAQGRACVCGRELGHSGVCSATWDSEKRVHGQKGAPAARAQDKPTKDRIGDDDLYQVISAAIPARTARHLRDEVTTDIFIAVRDGRIGLEQVPAAVKRIARQAYYAAKYAASSMDSAQFEDGSGSLHEVVSDNTAVLLIDEIEIGQPPT